MSNFIRPSLRKQLARWSEPIAASVIALVGARFLWKGTTRYDWMTQAIGLVLLLLGAAIFLAAFRRVQFKRDEKGPGLVEVTERQITYMTPVGGGSVDLEAMTRLEIRSTLEMGRVWVLKQSEGPTLFIPINAAGGEKLFDAFSALPGMEAAKLLSGFKTETDQRDVIWRGSPRYRALT